MTAASVPAMAAPTPHVPVLCGEVVRYIDPHPGGTYVDGTFGAGGYSRALLDAADCRVVGIDRDPQAVEAGRALEASSGGRLMVIEGRFGDMAELLDARGVTSVAGVALDLGVPQGGYAAVGFCDATYREGLRGLGGDSAETERLATLPAEGGARYGALLERGLLARYEAVLEGLVAERAAALRAEVRRLNPNVRFAFRSAQVPSDWFSLGLLRGFSDADAPVLLWTREPRMRDLLAHYRARGIFALSAVGLQPERVATNEWSSLRRVAFVEHDGFWLSWGEAPSPDSLGRLIRRLAR